jgi:N utilization substance protein B
MSDSPSQSKTSKPNSGLRREGREAAIQFLFQQDFQSVESAHEKAANLPVELPVPEPDFWKLRNGAADPDELNPLPARGPIAPKARAFAESLIKGVCLHQASIDELITRLAKNYRLSRIAAVDRNILRLAVFEIIHTTEVPPVVAINEAIELAKQFGSEDSGRFVNGLLDKVRAEFPRAARQVARAVVAGPGPVVEGAPPALVPDPLPTPV